LGLLPGAVSLLAIDMQLLLPWSYIVGKALMVALPLIIWYHSPKPWPQLRLDIGLTRTCGLPGLTIGIGFALAIYTSVQLYFAHHIAVDPIINQLIALDLREHYWRAALFFSFANAFMEEYYFRAFLVSQTLDITRRPVIVSAINGGFFCVHHLVILVTMLPIAQAIFLSLATAAAGFTWAFVRTVRTRPVSIIDCYISHIIADLAIFYCVWNMIK
jgi:membrane protease YdiL (CAAX protease family)